MVATIFWFKLLLCISLSCTSLAINNRNRSQNGARRYNRTATSSKKKLPELISANGDRIEDVLKVIYKHEKIRLREDFVRNVPGANVNKHGGKKKYERKPKKKSASSPRVRRLISKHDDLHQMQNDTTQFERQQRQLLPSTLPKE